MTEFCAAMGVTSLESRDEFIERNRQHSNFYRAALGGAAGVQVLFGDTPEHQNWQYIVVEIDSRAAGCTRDDVITALHAQNDLAKRYFWPGCHRIPPYSATHDEALSPLPETERLCDRLLQLPTGSGVTQLDIARIGDFIRSQTARRRRAA